MAASARQSETFQPQPESLRETADSIIVAFILAFVFRAFVIEAFVIPTGSMASTLNGAHGTMVCSNCGWEFAYGLADASTGGRGDMIDNSGVAFCRNCRFANRTTEINDRAGNYEAGDRILVLKWPYDIGGPLLGPTRWDVVVFKDPSDGVTNYIKRLAGLPDEVLEVIDGDVYSMPRAQLSDAAKSAFAELRHLKYLLGLRYDLDRQRVRRQNLPADIAAEIEQPGLLREQDRIAAAIDSILPELDGKLRIQRKSASAQDDLWRVAYDHDFTPQQHGEQQPAWAPQGTGSKWSVPPRRLRFEGLGTGRQSIQLRAALDSYCSYNAAAWHTPVAPQLAGFVPVSDTRLRFVIDYKGGGGSVRVGLTKRNDLFVAELASDGGVRVLRAKTDHPDDLTELGSKRLKPLQAGRMVAVSFENLDYRVRLYVDGEKIFESTDAQYSPPVGMLRTTQAGAGPLPFVSANDLDIELSHVVAESDIYYLSFPPAKAVPFGFRAWGTQDSPIELREGEYFMLGDNSAQSKDSRLWDFVGPHLLDRHEGYQLGTVPADQLIGRAFFVYWPSPIRTSLIPFLRETGWIPNFGQMRWIR